MPSLALKWTCHPWSQKQLYINQLSSMPLPLVSEALHWMVPPVLRPLCSYMILYAN